MSTVTEPDFNELRHVADLAKGRLEWEDSSSDGEGSTPWEHEAVQKLRDWVEALENLDPTDEVMLALAVLQKHNHLPLFLKELANDKNIEAVFTISTAHISQETAEALNGGSTFNLIVNDKGQLGWWFYVADHASWSVVPDDLKACLQMALNLGCSWLCLDQDAAQVENLEIWEW